MQKHLPWGKSKMYVIITSGYEGRCFHEWDIDQINLTAQDTLRN